MDKHREELLALFYEVDPWGLRELPWGAGERGVPADEYSPEVDKLSARENPTPEDLVRIFVEMGTSGTTRPGENPVFASYPAVSDRDASLLAEGIAHIRGVEGPGTPR